MAAKKKLGARKVERAMLARGFGVLPQCGALPVVRGVVYRRPFGAPSQPRSLILCKHPPAGHGTLAPMRAPTELLRKIGQLLQQSGAARHPGR
jgi:hypothetical protein